MSVVEFKRDLSVKELSLLKTFAIVVVVVVLVSSPIGTEKRGGKCFKYLVDLMSSLETLF